MVCIQFPPRNSLKLEFVLFEAERDNDAEGISAPEVIKVRVVTIDVPSIGIKFENFMQAGCRDLGSQPCTAESPLFCPNWYSFLEHF